MAPKARFVDGEKVLCFHGPLLYEAKCLKSMIKDKQLKYYIHYSGWNKNWDEWVSDCRVLKCNDANILKQKELEKQHIKEKKPKGGKSARKEVEKEPPLRVKLEKTGGKLEKAGGKLEKAGGKLEKTGGKLEKTNVKLEKTSIKVEKTSVKLEKTGSKPKNEKKSLTSAQTATSSKSAAKEMEPPAKKMRLRPEPLLVEEDEDVNTEIRITMTPELKNRLMDDSDLVQRQKKLVMLPARVTVDHIIAAYVKSRVSVKGLSKAKERTIVQVANKVRDCFNVFLGKNLLYKFERPQYAEMLAEYPTSSMCQIYSAIHFLRMFTQFGTLLTPLAKGDPKMPELVEHLRDFVKFMDSKQSFFSLDDYMVASPEYHRRAL